MGRRESLHTPWRTIIRGAGILATVAYAVVGALFVLVWNPMATVPGASLAAIRTGLDTANESLAAPLVIVWAAVGIALAVAINLGFVQRESVSTRQIAALYLWLLVLGAPSLWFASFPAGMALADAFDGTTGGDHAPWGTVLSGVSALALMALVVMGVMGKPSANSRAIPSVQ